MVQQRLIIRTVLEKADDVVYYELDLRAVISAAREVGVQGGAGCACCETSEEDGVVGEGGWELDAVEEEAGDGFCYR